MRSRKRTETVTETRSVLVVRRTGQPALVACPFCGGGPQMVEPESAARLARVSARTLYRWVEAGRVHYVETGDGRLLVCPLSLAGEPGAGARQTDGDQL